MNGTWNTATNPSFSLTSATRRGPRRALAAWAIGRSVHIDSKTISSSVSEGTSYLANAHKFSSGVSVVTLNIASQSPDADVGVPGVIFHVIIWHDFHDGYHSNPIYSTEISHIQTTDDPELPSHTVAVV